MMPQTLFAISKFILLLGVAFQVATFGISTPGRNALHGDMHRSERPLSPPLNALQIVQTSGKKFHKN